MSSFPKLIKSSQFDAELFKKVNPVVSITSYGNGVFRVNRQNKLQSHFDGANGRKDRKIKMLTSKSLQKLIATIQATDVNFNTMLTLTYPKIYPKNGKDTKQSLDSLLTYLRKQQKFSYLWFLEFQERGAPHFHILTSHKAITPKMRVRMAEKWVRDMIHADWFLAGSIVESIDCNKCEYDVMISHVKKTFAVALHRDTWQMIRDVNGAKKYVTKYASKPEQKVVPKSYQDVGRFWGCSRDVTLGGGKDIKTTEQEFGLFLEQQEHPTANFDVLPTFVYNVKNT